MRTLQTYNKKRDFKRSPEPAGKVKRGKARKLAFVVQEHHASHLHYDFRLELDGVLKSWAVPKGPSADPSVKRLAVEVEDHPLDYGRFQGEIPEDSYGAGEVFIWDAGSWIPEGDPHAGFKKGHLDFTLTGKRMKGRWTLIRTQARGGKANWLLFKRSDEYAGDNSRFGAVKDYGSRKERPMTIERQSGKLTKMPAKTSKKMPGFIEVQLPLLVTEAPEGKNWIHEIKFDGYRLQAHLDGGGVTLFTRSSQNWTNKYPSIAKALSSLKATSAILDGEVVALDAKGHSDFQDLQLAMTNGNESRLIYTVFDLLYLNGKDTRALPLVERKELLKTLLGSNKSKLVSYSDHIKSSGKAFLKSACGMELEGIVSKQTNAPYVSGRGSSWVKTKCQKRQEFVIGGFTDPVGHRKHFGALLLGIYEEGQFRYVGRCGTGFGGETLKTVWDKLQKLEISKSPFELKPPRERGLHWVKPELSAEISFSQWTRDEILRVPVFHGLREDKPARQITRDSAMPTLTHPDKILYPTEKITKKEIADFYLAVAPFMLPQISNRPLSLNRCPEGTGKACFFQKHFVQADSKTAQLSPLHPVSVPEKSGLKEYVTLDTPQGLVALVQMGAFEFHAWGSRQPEIEHPDQIVMDFDPDSGVSFAEVKKAALDLKATLDRLKLKSFLKVSGGKGLHVHIPVAPVYSWDQIKRFSKTLADEMAQRSPKKYLSTMSKALRKGKIFVDYLRNGRTATAVVPYSLRARKISAVAMPIEWKDLASIKDPAQFTLKAALLHLKKRKKDPWIDILKIKQRISILD